VQTPAHAPPHYCIERLLGSGQTSYVYLARHEHYGLLALKLLHEKAREDAVLKRMFENEVQLTLGLSHPNVIAAYDGFPTGEKAFLALEYCPGGTLEGYLGAGKSLTLKQRYRLIVDLGRGLEHCHGRGVLHRDVKPSNIFLTATRESKLGDFGSGVNTGAAGKERVGTAFYMAPEIFQGEEASVRSDIYSLGIVAFELICGQRPFEGGSYNALMLAHTSSLPRNLAHLRPEVDKDVVRVVMKAMARDPQKRYQSMRDFNQAFAQAIGLEPKPVVEAQVVGRSSRSGAKEPSPKLEDRGLKRWFGRKKA
jgi:eukaryotic-like serine/threonine-protein kinase